MVNVPEARKFGFRLELHDTAMAELLNSAAVEREVHRIGDVTRDAVEAHVRATASAADADNYVAALFAEDAFSDDYGFDYGGPYGLGNRPIAVVGIRSTGERGSRRSEKVNPDGRPPLAVEARTHALTSPPGVLAGTDGEDIR